VTNTEKTITVPVSAIEALRSGRDGLGAYGTTYVAAQSLFDLLPKPFKVGDVVTEHTWGDLPVGTVLRDRVGDIWFVGPNMTLSYLNPSRAKPASFELYAPDWDDYRPVIVSLPCD
jgi:hypothetical protein